jgi:hypothetical protein
MMNLLELLRKSVHHNGKQGAEIVHSENDVGCPPTRLSGDTYLIDLSVVKIRPSPDRALEHELSWSVWVVVVLMDYSSDRETGDDS